MCAGTLEYDDDETTTATAIQQGFGRIGMNKTCMRVRSKMSRILELKCLIYEGKNKYINTHCLCYTQHNGKLCEEKEHFS